MRTAAILLLLAGLTVPAASKPSGPRRPNIVLILADDLGWSDLGCYGGEIPTPNLDRLAADGLRFTQFYNGARCCPTRASLLTGLYPHQAGVGHMTGDAGEAFPGYRGRLTGDCLTLPELLRGGGYRTYMSGKWHLTESNTPVDRGFDEYFGLLRGTSSYWDPARFVRLPAGRASRTYQDGKFYATDALTDHAVDFLSTTQSNSDRPFFLYLAYTAPHFPLHASPADIARHEPIYQVGWDRIREKRLLKQKELGLVPRSSQLPPRSGNPPNASNRQTGWAGKETPAWDTLPADRRRDLTRRMATYAAMVERLDHGVGRVVEGLRRSGALENTLLLFLSDNGACAEWDPWGFDQGEPGGNKLHTGSALAEIGSPESHLSYGSGWAGASNTPWRLYKHYGHEGGISTPLIVHWPDRLSDRGAVRTQVGHIVDLWPTLAAAAGVEVPHQRAGKPLLLSDGKSLLPAFDGKRLERRLLAWEHEGNRAIRDGDWKAVALKDGPWELFDLAKDRLEQRDLATKHPDRLRNLTNRWDAWARRCQVIPAPSATPSTGGSR
jgi:arylsulfatase